jgi:hypothetical protein
MYFFFVLLLLPCHMLSSLSYIYPPHVRPSLHCRLEAEVDPHRGKVHIDIAASSHIPLPNAL